jgi:phage terminase large subunit GpA-like protein
MKVDPVQAGAIAGLRPPTSDSPWEWAAKHVRISNSERSSKFDPHQTPWWMAPMECAADADTRQVVILAPTGSGKSTMAEALFPFIVSEDPGNLLYASQTDTDAKFWGETRLQPALKSCAGVAKLWPEDRHKSRAMEILFPHMALVLGGANLSNFQEKSCRWLYGDEVAFWKPGLVREFLARHHNRWNRKVFLVSQGGEEEGELDLEWKKSDQSEFSWKCDCGTQQAFDFLSLKYDKIENADGTLNEVATSETTRMCCCSCGAEYADTSVVRRRLAGSNMDNGSRGYIAKADGNPGVRGFHIDSTAVWWVPWKDEVLGFLEANRLARLGVYEKLKQWRQKRRAQFWSENMTSKKVEISKSGFSKEEFADGQLVEGETIRFMAVDVQGSHFWAIVQAWKPGGASRIIFEGYIPGDGSDERALVQVAEKYGIKPNNVLIDIGFESPRIYDLCATHGWIGVKGEGTRRSFTHRTKTGNKVERLYSQTFRAKSPKGPLIPFVLLATNPLKDIASRLLSGEGAELEIPADVSKAFQLHMQAERREMVRAPRTGQETSVWVSKHRENHLWDCLVYSVGAALIFRIFGEN